ncbi:MAG: hypothetical protein LAT82_01860 [Nanoarchaeota archaeon]|nr:hypothetical protein [Nanoarchaeota archaeon]
MAEKKIKNKKSMSYEEQRELENRRTVKIFSVILLIVMGGSVIGFSIIGTPTLGGSGADGSRNVPFMEGLFQDGAGNTFDGAVLNGIQFIFYEDLTPYRNDPELITLSENLLQNKGSAINVYVDDGFLNDNARFFINQGLQVNSITTIPSQNLSCSQNPTLVYTTNVTNLVINNSVENCMIFEATSVEAQSLSNGLVFHLIKDVR